MTNLLKNNMLIWITVFTLVGGIIGGSVLAAGNYEADGAKQLEDYTLEDMLTYAIEDEYLARAEYEAIMEKYGKQRPFSNIIKAEENHIEELLPLFAKYDIKVPEDTAGEHVVIPDSVEEALKLGVQAEIDNIAMYEMFIEKDIPEDVRSIFMDMQKASNNHLEAFNRGVTRGQKQRQNLATNYGKGYGQGLGAREQGTGGGQGLGKSQGKGQGLGRLENNGTGRFNNSKDDCDCENCENEEISEGMRWFKNNEHNFGE